LLDSHVSERAKVTAGFAKLSLNTRSLHYAVGIMLAALSIVMAGHGLLSHAVTGAGDVSAFLLLFATVIGVGIGIVGSMLGVAGGELLIPTLVLLFGVDVKSAGTLSLTISVSMLLMTIWRLSHLPAAREALKYKRFIAVMCAGSLLGAFIGSALAGIAPEQAVSFILAAILFISAIKTFSK
jgi:uncharacterized membrane protein YfcA